MSDTQKTVTLGGRVFVAAETDDMTFDQFAWIQQAADKAGLGHELIERMSPVVQQALEKEQPLTEDQAKSLTEAIISRAYRERAHLDVLAGVLTPRGEEWSYEVAEETKAFLGKMKGRPDIETANVLLGQTVVAFFLNGLESMLTSLKSSDLVMVAAQIRDGIGSDQDSALATSE